MFVTEFKKTQLLHINIESLHSRLQDFEDLVDYYRTSIIFILKIVLTSSSTTVYYLFILKNIYKIILFELKLCQYAKFNIPKTSCPSVVMHMYKASICIYVHIHA